MVRNRIHAPLLFGMLAFGGEAVALTFLWEFGCTEASGESYTHPSNYGAVMHAFAGEGDTSAIALCGTSRVLFVSPGNDAQDILERALASTDVIRPQKLALMMRAEGHTAGLKTLTSESCLCSEESRRTARKTDWAAPAGQETD